MTTDLSIDGPAAEGSRSAAKRSEKQNREPKLPRPVKAKAPPKPKPEPIPYRPTSNPGEDEQTAVHEVYEAIAPHFSQTRHKVRLARSMSRGPQADTEAVAAHLDFPPLTTAQFGRSRLGRRERQIRAYSQRSGSGAGRDG